MFTYTIQCNPSNITKLADNVSSTLKMWGWEAQNCNGAGKPKAGEGGWEAQNCIGAGKPKAADGAGKPKAADGAGKPKSGDGAGKPKSGDGAGKPRMGWEAQSWTVCKALVMHTFNSSLLEPQLSCAKLFTWNFIISSSLFDFWGQCKSRIMKVQYMTV